MGVSKNLKPFWGVLITRALSFGVHAVGPLEFWKLVVTILLLRSLVPREAATM